MSNSTMTETEINTLVAKHSAFKSLSELVSQRHHGYRPTLDVAHPERLIIADRYDGCMAALGHEFRAYRYESESTKRQMKNLARRFARKAAVQVKEGGL